MTKRLLLTFYIFLGSSFLAIFLDSCGGSCGKNTIKSYTINGVNLEIYKIERDTLNSLKLKSSVIATTKDSLSYKKLAVDVTALHETQLAMIYRISNRLMACDPVPAELKLEKMELFSKQDWDSLHPAGTPLNDILKIYNKENKTITTVDEFLLSNKYYSLDKFQFIFEKAPKANGVKSFYMEIISDGKKIESPVTRELFVKQD